MNLELVWNNVYKYYCFFSMKFKIDYNHSNYQKVGLKLWFIKLFRRTIRFRFRLTMLVIIISLLVNLLMGFLGVALFLVIVTIVLIVDCFMFQRVIAKEIEDVEGFDSKSTSNVYISLDSENGFNYIFDGRQFRETRWNEMIEVCILDNPKVISFKNNLSRESEIIYESEIGISNFEKAKELFLKNISDGFMYWAD